MKNNEMSAAQALANKQQRMTRNRHIGFIAFLVMLAIMAIVSVIAIVKMKENERIQLAQNLISQYEINTTYREAELDPNGDEDSDGVLNDQEQRRGTNPQDEDSDNDGLTDGDEVALGTDPLNPDTDGDGLMDGYELINGLDPTKASTDGTTKDSDVKVEYEKTCGDVTLNVSGNANIADVSICEMDIFGISSNMGIIGTAYDLTTDYSFDSATITFKPDKDEVSRKGAKFSELSVLKFNTDTHTYDKLESKADSSAGTVSAEISSYGTYVIGVEKTVNEPAVTQIAFLLDNSGSMYPVEICEVSPENDVNFRRLDFTKSLIEKIEGDGDYLYSLAKFTGTYTKLQGFTKDTKKLNEAIEKIRADKEVFDGSHIETALESCISTFDDTESSNTRNIIVLLTDGASDEQNAKSISELAELAKKNNIIIMTIGLGKEADRPWLLDLSAATGGKYYSASDAEALNSVYKQIVTTLNYDLVDYSDSDEQATGYSLYNTGFDPVKNGFSIKNFRTSDTPSVDYGMAIMARDWYVGRLPMSLGSLSPFEESEQKYDADGYDLTGTEIEKLFKENQPLSGVVPTMMTGKFSDVKQYLDFSKGGSVLKIKNGLLSEAIKQGWSVKTYKLEADNLGWEKVELLSLDLVGSADKIEKASSAQELQFYKALYRLNAIQWDDANVCFDLFGGDEGFELLKSLLARGEPVVTIIDGSHAVNAVGLIQDSEDHRNFVLEVYDSNYPGTLKKIYITRAVKGEFDIENGKAQLKDVTYQYTCEYEGKQVGITFSDAAAE